MLGEGHGGIRHHLSAGMSQGTSPGLWGESGKPVAAELGACGAVRACDGGTPWRERGESVRRGSESPEPGRGPGVPGREPWMSARLSRGFSLCPEGANSPDPHSLWCEELPGLRRFSVTQFRTPRVSSSLPLFLFMGERSAGTFCGDYLDAGTLRTPCARGGVRDWAPLHSGGVREGNSREL